MAFEGMDIGQVQTMGHQMQQKADEIQNSIIPAIDHLVSQIPGVWRGPDASQFQQWWQGQHRGQMLTAAQDLRGLGQSALNNASEQQSTSAH